MIIRGVNMMLGIAWYMNGVAVRGPVVRLVAVFAVPITPGCGGTAMAWCYAFEKSPRQSPEAQKTLFACCGTG